MPRNLAFMCEVSWITGFSDLGFLPDYVLGMSTLGWSDVAPRFVPRTTEPLYNMSNFWMDVDQHNERIMSRVRSSGDPKLDEESWKKSKAEFECGSLVGPFFSVKEVQAAVSYTHLTLPTNREV